MTRVIRFSIRVFQNFGANECLSYAAAIAYWALFSVFPLLILVMGLLGAFVHGPQQREAAVGTIFTVLGGSVGEDVLRTQIDALAQSAGQAGVIALVLALWSASSVFGAIRTGIAAVWGTSSKQPLVIGKLFDLAMVLVLGVLVIGSLLATTLLTTFTEFSTNLFGKDIGHATRALIALCSILVPGAISFLAFLLIYRIVPRVRLRLGDVWVGAIVAAALFQVAQIGFGIYVGHFANYQRVYGSLGAVIALLTFMYFSAAILLLGVEITKTAMPSKDVVPRPKPETLVDSLTLSGGDT
ncbi:MAG TPA: YihY/virulence factor BrkB family protein [Dehalococcoidia bacterium]|nr:YihY/virulence factor BrkB family protein [Dehalococcoidia bacterium]